MASKFSPTQKSLKYLRDNGYTAQVVERYVSFTHRRIDLFGAIDICAVKPGDRGVLGVQTTSSSNHSARVTKAKAIPEIKVWLEAGNRLVFHSWGLKGKVGKRKTYQLREEELFVQDLEAELKGKVE
jgi:hypothetical protein